jgi:hypothetical protein
MEGKVMNFAETNRRYEELKQQYMAGTLSAEDFDTALRDMMIQDEQGRWWAKARESGEWNYYDEGSSTWIAAQPPASPPPTSTRPSPPPPSGSTMQAPNPRPSVASPGPATTTVGVGPEITPTLTIIFYVVSFFVPLVGVILFFMYRTKPHPSDRNVAKVSLILGVVSLLLSCMCTFMLMLGQINTGYY